MFILLLWWMLTVDNCIDTKPTTPTSTTWSNQNIIDWPVMLCTLQEQKEVLWRTPTTWLHAWPGMVRRPITSIAKGEDWCGEATGLRISLQTSGNTQRLQAKQNKNDDLAMCLSSKVPMISFDDILMYITYHCPRTPKSLSCHVYHLKRRLTVRASYLMQLSLLAA